MAKFLPITAYAVTHYINIDNIIDIVVNKSGGDAKILLVDGNAIYIPQEEVNKILNKNS